MFSRHEKLSEVDTQRANPTTIPNLKSNRSMIQKLPTIKVCRAESCINNKAKWSQIIIKMWTKKRRGLTKTKDELGRDSAMHGLQQRFTKQTLDFWHSHLNYANCNCCKTALLENNSRICGSNIYAPIQLEPILCIFCNFEIEGLLKWFSVDIVLEELYQKLRAKINRPEIAFLWLLQKM